MARRKNAPLASRGARMRLRRTAPPGWTRDARHLLALWVAPPRTYVSILRPRRVGLHLRSDEAELRLPDGGRLTWRPQAGDTE